MAEEQPGRWAPIKLEKVAFNNRTKGYAIAIRETSTGGKEVHSPIPPGQYRTFDCLVGSKWTFYDKHSHYQLTADKERVYVVGQNTGQFDPRCQWITLERPFASLQERCMATLQKAIKNPADIEKLHIPEKWKADMLERRYLHQMKPSPRKFRAASTSLDGAMSELTIQEPSDE